jgi:antitoxin component YwqK of YwqJK toxin-antitoxin module
MKLLQIEIALFLVFFLTSCAKLELISENENDNLVRSYQINSKTKEKHGTYKEYFDGKLILERTYKKNKIEGKEKTYFDNGSIDGIFTFKNGIYEGEFSFFFEEEGTTKQKGTYINGKIEGPLYTYYSDGTLKEKVVHAGGYTKGLFEEYNRNGTLSAEGTYTFIGDRENLEHGLLKLYDENGTLEHKMICKEGQCCAIWTLEDGDRKPSGKLCESIIESMKEE